MNFELKNKFESFSQNKNKVRDLPVKPSNIFENNNPKDNKAPWYKGLLGSSKKLKISSSNREGTKVSIAFAMNKMPDRQKREICDRQIVLIRDGFSLFACNSASQ